MNYFKVKLRLSTSNKCYYVMKKMFLLNLLPCRTKERLYTTCLCSIVTYTCETWASTKGNEEKLAIFKRKILKKIYGSVHNVDLGIFKKNKKVTKYV